MFESLHAVKPLAVPLEFWHFDVMSMEDGEAIIQFLVNL